MWRKLWQLSDALTAYTSRLDRRGRGVPSTPIAFDEVVRRLDAIATGTNVVRGVKQFETFWWANVNDERIPASGEQWDLVADFVGDFHMFESKAEWREAGMFAEDEMRSKAVKLLKMLGHPAAT